MDLEGKPDQQQIAFLQIFFNLLGKDVQTCNSVNDEKKKR